jgi:hypothetical protein
MSGILKTRNIDGIQRRVTCKGYFCYVNQEGKFSWLAFYAFLFKEIKEIWPVAFSLSSQIKILMGFLELKRSEDQSKM